MKPRDTMFNKGRSGLLNFNMSMSDSSPGTDHREKSGIPVEGQIRTSSEDAERPTVRSMKFFFEAKMKGESKNSVSKIASDEEVQPKKSKTISKEESTPPKTSFRAHPRQSAGKIPSDLPLLRSVSTRQVTTPQGLHPVHADQDQLPGEAPLALSDPIQVPSLRTAQKNHTTSAAVDADSYTDASPPIKPHINNLSLDLTFGPIFPPSPPLTPKTPKSTTYIDNSLRSTKLNTVSSREAGGLRSRLQLRSDSDPSPDAPSSPSQRHVRKNSVADKRTDKRLKETRDNTIEFLSALRETPVKAESYSNHIHEPPPKATCSHISEVQELQDQLASAMRDLQVAKDETLVYKNSTVQINKDLERLAKDLNGTTSTHESLVLRHDRTRSELQMVRDDFKRLLREKRGWQEQFDVMHHQVVQAERQIRCLNHLTKARFEARQDDVFGSPARTKKLAALSIDPSTKVVNTILSLNAKIQQLANKFIENYLEPAIFCPIRPQSSVVVKAKKMLGEDLTQMLQAQPKMKTSTLYQLLVTVVLEVFLVQWCSSIIEGWYPERPSFSDLLAKLSSQVTGVSPSTSPTQCGKQMRVIETLNVASPEFPAWAADAFDDLSDILMIGGLSISSQGQILSTIRDLFELAYDIRVALAEKDICRLELVVVGPGTPFHPKWMDESHTLMGKGTMEMLSKMEPTIGTTSMGLKRMAKATKNDEQPYLVKPKVVTARVL